MVTFESISTQILALKAIRGTPQFLFMDGVHYDSLLKVRESVIQFKHQNPDIAEIDFIIESPGGSADDAYKIIRTLRKNFLSVNIIVPFWVKSAATLLSLGGTQIIMDEFAEFGPLDVQLRKEKDDSPDFERESALNDEYSLKRIETRALELYQNMFSVIYEDKDIPINKNELSQQLLNYLAKFYKPLLEQINPYKLGDKKRKLEIGEKYAEKILKLYHPVLPKEKKDFLVDYFINGCPDHGYVIDYDTITSLLDGVQKSSIFGPDYETRLQALSISFMKNFENVTFVGFIEEPAAPSPVEPQQSQINNDQSQ
jgi:hypothetical protein